MLYQLRATVDNVSFIAVVCTSPLDLLDLSKLPAQSLLSKYYPDLISQVKEHRKVGLSADYTFPWPMMNFGFDRFEAIGIFHSWQGERWMAYSEGDDKLIESPLQRKTVTPGNNLFKGLDLVRRISVHPLLMVKISEGIRGRKRSGYLVKPSSLLPV